MKFELFKSENDSKFYFNLKAANGQTILASQGYTDKAAAENGINSVQKNCVDDRNFEKKEAANGKYHFNLVAANKQIIGTSQMYTTQAAMETGISSVKTNAPKATVEDMSMAN